MPPKKTVNKTNHLNRYLERLQGRIASARSVSERFVRWRTVITLAGIATGFLLYRAESVVLFYFTMLSFATVFFTVFYFHSRLKKRLLRLIQWQTIKREHLARLSLNWNGLPETKSYAVPEEHPYARDVDIVGPYSLLRLLDTTISTWGRRKLTSWLLSPDPAIDSMERRQRLVRELVPRSLLRDRIRLEIPPGSTGELNSDQMLEDLRNSSPPPGLGGNAVGSWINLDPDGHPFRG